MNQWHLPDKLLAVRKQIRGLVHLNLDSGRDDCVTQTTISQESDTDGMDELDLTSRGKPVAQVAILLCTYHGQNYLAEQLDSFAAQTDSDWVVWASDDSSTDSTCKILQSYVAKWGEDRLSIHRGPGQGFTANFLSLISHADISADYYAYADQDDTWEPDKLERAVGWLRSIPDNTPALYCTRTRIVDANNTEIGFSPLFTKTPGFANALVQNLAGGNTMVFNNAARKLLQAAGEDIDIVIHDWWTYLVVTGCGGQVHYDPYPSVRYRQHGANLVGGNSTWSDRMSRVQDYRSGKFKYWNEQNIRALEKIRGMLTYPSQKTLDLFSQSRESWFLPRILGIKRSGVYRQTLFGNITLFAAAIFGKI